MMTRNAAGAEMLEVEPQNKWLWLFRYSAKNLWNSFPIGTFLFLDQIAQVDSRVTSHNFWNSFPIETFLLVNSGGARLTPSYFPR